MSTSDITPTRVKELRWATARILFIAYIGSSILTLVGGYLTAPVMTWCFYGDWRFWRYWRSGIRLLPHGVRLLALMAKDSRAFLFAVPLTSPPRRIPIPARTVLRSDWLHGSSCGSCSNCCRFGGNACPLLASKDGHCLGYNSFYWRYFNCGRFPSVTDELNYYKCAKWLVVPTPVPANINPNPGLNVLDQPPQREPT